MIERDEFVGWEVDGAGRVVSVLGRKGEHSLRSYRRFLMPHLSAHAATPGDLLHVARSDPFFGMVLGVANVSRSTRIVARADRFALLFLAACALPVLVGSTVGTWFTLAFGSVNGIVMIAERWLAGRRLASVTGDEPGAARARMAWLVERELLGLPPPPESDPPSTEERLERLARAFHGRLPGLTPQRIGEVDVPDGRLLACEPFAIDHQAGREIDVPAGRWPVVAALADFGGDERIAYAWVRCGAGDPVSWRAPDTVDGASLGFGVDSGFACFVSADVVPHAIARLPDGSDDVDDYREALNTEILKVAEPTYAATREWAEVQFGGRSLVAFTSGYGDGFYSVYAAADAEGRTVAIAIDFELDDGF